MPGPGDLIFHPEYGLGTISGPARRDPRHPIEDFVVSAGAPDQAQDHHDIQIMDGATLLVPVSGADRAGLAPPCQR